MIFRCFECKKNDKEDFNNDFIKRFANIYEFCNEEFNKFILLLRKGVYPYKYMDSWEEFMEDIADAGHSMQKECSKTLVRKMLVIIMIFMFKVIHYYLQMYLKILETNVLKYMN